MKSSIVLFTIFVTTFIKYLPLEGGISPDFFDDLVEANKTIFLEEGQEAYLTSAESFIATSSYSRELVRRESFFWEPNQTTPHLRLRIRACEDIEKQALYWHDYQYDETGRCHLDSLCQGQYIDRIDSYSFLFSEPPAISSEMIEEEVWNDTLKETVLVRRLFDSNIDAVDDLQALNSHELNPIVIFKYAVFDEDESSLLGEQSISYVSELSSSNFEALSPRPAGDVASPLAASIDFEGAPSTTFNFLAKTSDLQESLSYFNYVEKEWNDAMHQIFTGNFLRMTGFYQHEAESGTFGYGEEINDKVRVTLINGILNIRADLHGNLHKLSKSHGGLPIHFVFRPTEGWMPDLTACCMVKAGYVSAQAKLLAVKWKELIQEMGGVNGGGVIVHYAHSVGGSDTYAAKDLLTADEQNMIHVITIGSPTMIPNKGFASVTNYVSKRDGISWFGLPAGWLSNDTTIVYVGTFKGIPLIEHTLGTDTYSDLINTLGAQFLDTYSETKDEALALSNEGL